MQINKFIFSDEVSLWERNDRQWFKNNKGRSYRSRKPFPDELVASGIKERSNSYFIIIKQLNKNSYLSQVINNPIQPPDSEKILCIFFDVTLEGHKNNISFGMALMKQLGGVK